MAELTVRVVDMHCEKCRDVIEDALRDIPGVVSVSTNIAEKEMRVICSLEKARLLLDDICRVVRKVGYTPEPADDTVL